MLQSSVPAKFQLAWASNAGGAFIRTIPTSSQIGIQAGAASLNDGFPPVCFTPVGSGGTPPFGQDFNGIINQMSAWNQWHQAGGPVFYDSTWATSGNVNGYPKGAIIRSSIVPDNYWICLADNNQNNPDTAYNGGGLSNLVTNNWGQYGPSTGDLKHRPTSETIPGWTIANATTVGSGSSGASQRANADTQLLYTWLWTNFSNTQCPVTGGRGATAAADFAANKPIQHLDLRGMGVFGMDTMAGAASTRLTSVPVTSGNATTAGSVLGENLHALIIAELAAHTHTYSGFTSTTAATITTANIAGPQQTNTSGSTGSGTAHNTVPLVMVGTWYVKL